MRRIGWVIALAGLFLSGPAFAQDAASGPDVAQMKAACEANNAKACLALAGSYATGTKGAPKDLAQAELYFGKACDVGGERACLLAGKFYQTGQMGPGKEEAGLRLLEYACRTPNKSVEGCMLAGAGNMKSPDGEAMAINLFERACGLGEGQGCLSAGMLFNRREYGLPSAADMFDKACAKQIQDGCAMREATNMKLTAQTAKDRAPIDNRYALMTKCAISYEASSELYGSGIGEGLRGLTYHDRALASMGIPNASGKALPDDIKTRSTAVAALVTGGNTQAKTELSGVVGVCEDAFGWAPIASSK